MPPASLPPDDLIGQITQSPEYQTLAAEAHARGIADVSLEDSRDRATIARLRSWVAETILPTDAFAAKSPYYEPAQVSSVNVERVRSLKAAGLRLLVRLQLGCPFVLGDGDGDEDEVLAITCLASFTDERDAWVTRGAYEDARVLLSQTLGRIKGSSKLYQTLMTQILRHQVKPLFAKSKTPLLTAQGRKAIYPLPAAFETVDVDAGNKLWKYRSPHIVTVFKWVLEQIDGPLVESNWPLIIPPILTLLDDASVECKIRGCESLLSLLKKTHSSLLERTGLGEVFHNALLPLLLYLPTLTPEEESLPLLEVVYTTLIELARARHPADGQRHLRLKTLDQVFRYGILQGYSHAGEHVKIANLLLHKTTSMVHEMGIHFVKHLNRVLPILSSVLVAPLGTAYPPLLMTAVQTIQVIVLYAWPRVPFHKADILESLVICWHKIDEEKGRSRELENVRQRIEETVSLLAAISKKDASFEDEMQALADADPRLQRLLTGKEST
ncbi:MAG: hypothetical protein Q9214_002552 [Letrouitia sp. 1 TL-2023]